MDYVQINLNENENKNGINYKELCLSATRAKLSYSTYDEIKNYWQNYNNLGVDSILYCIFENMQECPKYHSNLDETAVAFTWIEDKTFHIMFRGTNNHADIIMDTSICRSKLFADNNSILVHRGFLEYFMLLEKSICDEIIRVLSNVDIYDIKNIQFNSHSLGAAAASIAVCWYKRMLEERKDIKFINYTIGSPRVGNNHFIKFFKECVNTNVRIHNKKDPVALFPISILYNHVDDSICIQENCSVIEKVKDDNWFIRLLKLPFQLYYRSLIHYHQCDVYINNLLQISGWNIKK